MENLYNNSKGIVELKTSELIKMPNGDVLVNRPEFKNKVYLMAFYAPWCGHCVRMAPDVKKLASKLVDEGFMVGAINCEANADLDSKIEIYSFPTLFFVKDNKPLVYNEARDIDSMVNFLCKTLGKCSGNK